MSLTASQYISLDHTFKIASNIGYVRGDDHWVTQYSSVYFEKNRLAYERYIMSLTASQYISLDHTFKIASNIMSEVMTIG